MHRWANSCTTEKCVNKKFLLVAKILSRTPRTSAARETKNTRERDAARIVGGDESHAYRVVCARHAHRAKVPKSTCSRRHVAIREWRENVPATACMRARCEQFGSDRRRDRRTERLASRERRWNVRTSLESPKARSVMTHDARSAQCRVPRPRLGKEASPGGSSHPTPYSEGRARPPARPLPGGPYCCCT